MIAIATKDFEPFGSHIYRQYEQTNLYKSGRRYQRVATLDGGMAFELRGLFDADREFSVIVPFSDDLQQQLSAHSHWTVSTIDGCFEMFLSDWNTGDNGITLELKGV